MTRRVLEPGEVAIEQIPAVPRRPPYRFEELERLGQRRGLAAALALRGRVRFGDAPVDLGDRLLQLRAAPFVSGRAQLTLELGAG